MTEEKINTTIKMCDCEEKRKIRQNRIMKNIPSERNFNFRSAENKRVKCLNEKKW